MSAESDCDNIFEENIATIKKKLKFCNIKEDDKWKVDFVKEIVDIKQKVLEMDNNLMTNEEFDEIIAYLTTS